MGKSSVKPLAINSTAMEKMTKPMMRVITFIPVLPNIEAIFGAIHKVTSTLKATVPMAKPTRR